MVAPGYSKKCQGGRELSPALGDLLANDPNQCLQKLTEANTVPPVTLPPSPVVSSGLATSKDEESTPSAS